MWAARYQAIVRSRPSRHPVRAVKPKASRARPPLRASPFPPVDRDFAFVVDEEVPAEVLLAAVRATDKMLIREVSLFDVYTGPGLDDGKKSLAVAVRLQAQDHTLSEAEIEATAKKIVAAASKATGARSSPASRGRTART